MRAPKLSDERGIALAMAVFALVVIGALVAGVFFSGMLEQRSGQNTMQLAKATEAAEAGVSDVIASWGTSNFNGLAVGDSAVVATVNGTATTFGARNYYRPVVKRLTPEVFLVRSEGGTTGGGGGVVGRRTIAALLRTVPVTISMSAAVSVASPIKFNGNAFTVSGINTAPPGWTGCTAAPDVSAVRSSTGTGVGSQDLDNISGAGTPPYIGNDSSVTRLTNSVFGPGGMYDQLAAQATTTLTSSSPYNGVGPDSTIGAPANLPHPCNTAKLLNFGEPNRGAGTYPQCTGYFPVIHGTGSQTKFTGGGRGQGVLLVDGDLEIAGGFQFYGLMLVKGSIKLTGNGNKVYGGLLAQNGAEIDDNSIAGNTSSTYSSCSIARALASAPGGVTLLGRRNWVQLYN